MSSVGVCPSSPVPQTGAPVFLRSWHALLSALAKETLHATIQLAEQSMKVMSVKMQVSPRKHQLYKIIVHMKAPPLKKLDFLSENDFALAFCEF